METSIPVENTTKIKKIKTVKPKKEKPLFKSNPTPLLPNHSDESSLSIPSDYINRFCSRS